MTAPAFARVPSPSTSTSGSDWATYSSGMILRCPGQNTQTRRPCQAGMGQVGAGRQVKIRERGKNGAADDPKTDLFPICRRCRSELEVQIVPPR